MSALGGRMLRRSIWVRMICRSAAGLSQSREIRSRMEIEAFL